MRTCVHQLPPEASIQQGPQATPEDLELPTIVTAAVLCSGEKNPVSYDPICSQLHASPSH